jgi:hypothetical protein
MSHSRIHIQGPNLHIKSPSSPVTRLLRFYLPRLPCNPDRSGTNLRIRQCPVTAQHRRRGILGVHLGAAVGGVVRSGLQVLLIEIPVSSHHHRSSWSQIHGHVETGKRGILIMSWNPLLRDVCAASIPFVRRLFQSTLHRGHPNLPLCVLQVAKISHLWILIAAVPHHLLDRPLQNDCFNEM